MQAMDPNISGKGMALQAMRLNHLNDGKEMATKALRPNSNGQGTAMQAMHHNSTGKLTATKAMRPNSGGRYLSNLVCGLNSIHMPPMPARSRPMGSQDIGPISPCRNQAFGPSSSLLLPQSPSTGSQGVSTNSPGRVPTNSNYLCHRQHRSSSNHLCHHHAPTTLNEPSKTGTGR